MHHFGDAVSGGGCVAPARHWGGRGSAILAAGQLLVMKVDSGTLSCIHVHESMGRPLTPLSALQ